MLPHMLMHIDRRPHNDEVCRKLATSLLDMGNYMRKSRARNREHPPNLIKPRSRQMDQRSRVFSATELKYSFLVRSDHQNAKPAPMIADDPRPNSPPMVAFALACCCCQACICIALLELIAF